MYQFAVVALLGLATLKVVDLLEELVPALARLRALLVLAIGIAAAVALDYSLFRGFHIAVRHAWMGTWATGFVIGGLSTVWRVVFGWLGFTEPGRVEDRQPRRPRMAA